jgi:hypothetical protein
MLMVVVVTGARMGSGTLMDRVLKVVNVRTISLLLLNYGRTFGTLRTLGVWHILAHF